MLLALSAVFIWIFCILLQKQISFAMKLTGGPWASHYLPAYLTSQDCCANENRKEPCMHATLSSLKERWHISAIKDKLSILSHLIWHKQKDLRYTQEKSNT